MLSGCKFRIICWTFPFSGVLQRDQEVAENDLCLEGSYSGLYNSKSPSRALDDKGFSRLRTNLPARYKWVHVSL